MQSQQRSENSKNSEKHEPNQQKIENELVIDERPQQIQETINIPVEIYNKMKRDLEKLQYENYALKHQIQLIHRNNRRDGQKKMQKFYHFPSLALRNKHILQAKIQEDENEHIEDDLMVSCSPMIHHKTSLDEKSVGIGNNNQKNKQIKEMKQWAKQIDEKLTRTAKEPVKKQGRKSEGIYQHKESQINEEIHQEDIVDDQEIPANIPQSMKQIPVLDHNLKASSDDSSQFVEIRSEPDEKQQKQKQPSSIVKKKPKQSLIQSICLFGPSDKKLQELAQGNSRKFIAPQEVLYSMPSNKEVEEKYGVYGEYFYPDEKQAVCRKIKQEEKNTQAHQAIFRKNAKRQDCSIFMFRGDELWEGLYGVDDNQYNMKHNDNQWVLMNKINPGKILYAFVIQFYDYTIVEHPKQQTDKINKSHEVHVENQSTPRQNKIHESELLDAKQENKKSDRVLGDKVQMVSQFIKSKYTLCIFTYYPLVNPIEQMMAAIIDEIKIKRVEKFAESQSDLAKVTIHFFIRQLRELSVEINKDIHSIPVRTPSNQDHHHVVAFGNKKITFNLSKDNLYETMFSGWAYEILKQFQKDHLYDLFSFITFEESVCFVSENLSLLTHTLFFFVAVLLHPFSYPYPLISLVQDLQFLDSPFIVITGIYKSSKWLEQNFQSLNQKKIFIDLNAIEPKFRLKLKPKVIKSQKIRKVFSNFFKRMPDSIPQIFKKKETVIKAVTKQENQNAYQFIYGIRRYFEEQIINYLPNPEIINYLKNTINSENETEKMFHLLKEAEKYVRESRKQKQKDSFIQLFLQQQIFYTYVTTHYGLQ